MPYPDVYLTQPSKSTVTLELLSKCCYGLVQAASDRLQTTQHIEGSTVKVCGTTRCRIKVQQPFNITLMLEGCWVGGQYCPMLYYCTHIVTLVYVCIHRESENMHKKCCEHVISRNIIRRLGGIYALLSEATAPYDSERLFALSLHSHCDNPSVLYFYPWTSTQSEAERLYLIELGPWLSPCPCGWFWHRDVAFLATRRLLFETLCDWYY